MNQKTLVLKLQPVTYATSFALERCKISYAVFNSKISPADLKTETADFFTHSLYGKLDYQRTNLFFNEMMRLPVTNQSLLDFTYVDGTSMWQFLPSFIWPEIFRAQELVDILLPLVDAEKPSQIIVLPVLDHSSPIWKGINYAIADKFKIPLFWLPTKEKNSFKSFFALLKDRTREILFPMLDLATDLKNHLTNKRSRGTDCDKKVLFVTNARYWVDDPDLKSKKKDEQFYPLLKILEQKGWESFVGINSPYQLGFEYELKSRIQKDSMAAVKWRGYFDGGHSYPIKYLRAWTKCRRLGKQLLDDANFRRSFCYKEVPLLPALSVLLRTSFFLTLPTCYRCRLVSRSFLLKEKPKAMLATYETGPFERTTIFEAGQVGIPSIGLMHGMIFTDNYDYSSDIIISPREKTRTGFVAPDLTCVWGDHWKDVLTKFFHYPREVIQVTGNWRYDSLNTILSEEEKSNFRKTRNISPDKKIVFILSADQKTPKYLTEIFQYLQSKPQYYPLLKLHPRENPSIGYQILEKFGYPDNHMIKLSDDRLAALLNADLIVSQYSTIVSEAALMDKPIILVDLEKLLPDPAYKDSGVCLYVESAEQIAKAVESALESEAVLSKLKNCRDAFKLRYFNGNDGKASERVALALEALVSKQKTNNS